MNPSSTTYTAGGALMVGYNASTTTGNLLNATIPTTAVATTTTTAGYTFVACTSTAAGVTPNVGISLGVASATNFATGTGTAKVFVNYYIITI